MIYYRPTDGGPLSAPVGWQPKTVFLMQQLTDPIPPRVLDTRARLEAVLRAAAFDSVDATSRTTGRDFLLNVWQQLVACPVGIAIVHEGIAPTTLANIYYELGMMQAFGRETLVIKVGEPNLPSDLVRTEYAPADAKLESRLEAFVTELAERASHYRFMADQLENNPLLSIDYLRRAFLLTGDEQLRVQAELHFMHGGLDGRARSSVERMLVNF